MLMIDHSSDIHSLRPLLTGLDQYYPGMHKWLDRLAIEESTPILVAHENNRVVAACIGKKTIKERKIRCVRVQSDYANKGIGIRLMDQMIDVLECRSPYCTVSEEMLHQYSRAFIQRYGFSLDEVKKGMYRPGKLEYVFNC